MTPKKNLRIFLFSFSAMALVAIFLFQRFNYAEFVLSVVSVDKSSLDPYFIFSLNKAIRFILNDAMAIVMIYSIFYERKYVLIAIIVQLFGMLILLPSYLYLNYHYHQETRGWLSYLHRLTMNPTLLMLLIPAFLYQRRMNNTNEG